MYLTTEAQQKRKERSKNRGNRYRRSYRAQVCCGDRISHYYLMRLEFEVKLSYLIYHDLLHKKTRGDAFLMDVDYLIGYYRNQLTNDQEKLKRYQWLYNIQEH